MAADGTDPFFDDGAAQRTQTEETVCLSWTTDAFLSLNWQHSPTLSEQQKEPSLLSFSMNNTEILVVSSLNEVNQTSQYSANVLFFRPRSWCDRAERAARVVGLGPVMLV